MRRDDAESCALGQRGAARNHTTSPPIWVWPTRRRPWWDLVGQNLGARRPERAERAVWITAWYSFYFLGAVGLVFVILAGPITGLFSHEPAVWREATRGLRIASLGFPLYAFAMAFTQAFNSAGDTGTSTVIHFFCFWLWEIPIALLL